MSNRPIGIKMSVIENAIIRCLKKKCNFVLLKKRIDAIMTMQKRNNKNDLYRLLLIKYIYFNLLVMVEKVASIKELGDMWQTAVY